MRQFKVIALALMLMLVPGGWWASAQVNVDSEPISETVSESVDALVDATVETADELMDEALEVGDEFVDEALESVDALVDDASEAADELLDEAVESVDSLIDEAAEITDHLAGEATEVVTSADDLIDEAVHAGVDLLDSAIEAVEEVAADSVADVVAVEEVQADDVSDVEAVEEVQADDVSDVEAVEEAQADDVSDVEAVEEAQADDGADVEAVEEVQADDGADVEAVEEVQADDAADAEEIDEAQAEDARRLEQLGEIIEQVRGASQSAPDPSQARTQADLDEIAEGKPVLEEQFVWSVSAWTGTSYEGSFAAKHVPTLYIMADHPSIMNTQRTQVYYWPITGEYMADWFGMREEVVGTMEILQKGKVIQTLEKTDYSYYFPGGAAGHQELYLGEEAQRIYDDYQARLDAFYAATSQYYEDRREWDRMMNDILREVRETGIYKDPDEIPPAPKEPKAPSDFAYAPRVSFAVELPEGKYTIRLRDENGQIVPGSERQLVAFAPRRVGVTYTVIPTHKWTRRFVSHDEGSVIFQDQQRSFFLIPESARQFNLYNYVKMTNLHKPLEGEGMRNALMWAPFGEISGEEATLQVIRDGQVVEEVKKSPYYVQQTAGYALGYEIVDFDPENNVFHQGRSPTFEAFKVSVPADGTYRLQLVDTDGNVIRGSQREIRPVTEPGNTVYWVTALPLGVGLVMFGGRRTVRGMRKRRQ